MFTSRRHNGAAAALCALMAACGTERTTAPEETARFDAQRLTADVQATERAMNPSILSSFAALSAHFDLGAIATSTIAGSRDVVGTPDDLTVPAAKQLALTTAERLMGAVASDVGLASPALRPESLGSTYIYDPTLHRYVVAPDRSGAPANGVRFILYAVNPVTHEPITAVEIGHADLIDEGAGSLTGIALRLIVVSEGTTYLDYRVALDGSPTAGTLDVSGFVTDGATRLVFHIAATGASGPGGATLNVAFDFGVPARAFAVVGTVVGEHSLSGDLGRIHLVVRSGETKIDVAITGDDRTVNATILVNDQIFATVTGDHRNPAIRGAGGRELTAEEAQALHGILGLVAGVFQLFGNLLQPVGAILALSTIP